MQELHDETSACDMSISTWQTDVIPAVTTNERRKTWMSIPPMPKAVFIWRTSTSPFYVNTETAVRRGYIMLIDSEEVL